MAAEAPRTVRVTLCLTAAEKAHLDRAARRLGITASAAARTGMRLTGILPPPDARDRRPVQ